MKLIEFNSMAIDELWQLHEEIGRTLASKLVLEKRELEARLNQLRRQDSPQAVQQRRPYPKVHPKYQNPANPLQTWTGRGKTPRWVSEIVDDGKSIDELRIPEKA